MRDKPIYHNTWDGQHHTGTGAVQINQKFEL